MKTTVSKIMVALLVVMAMSSKGFSQTKEENHAALTMHHNKVKEHTDAIVNGTSKTKAEHLAHATEAINSLKEAKKAQGNLKTNVAKKDKTMALANHVEIAKQDNEAAGHLKAIKDELKKPKYDEAKVKDHAKKAGEAIDKAEQEHQKLKEKTK